MRVGIAGGHGRIALRLARPLHERGDAVVSLVRNATHFDDVRGAGAEPVLCDLETASPSEVAAALGAADTVVFAAGAGPGSGAARKETVDFGGAAKLIAAAQQSGIGRYVMISSRGPDASRPGDDVFAVYLRAKGRADDELIASGLDYTVVRPVRLTEGAGTGRIEIGGRVRGRTIPRDDVAAVVVGCLSEPATVGHVFEVAAGAVPIDEALQGFTSGTLGPNGR